MSSGPGPGLALRLPDRVLDVAEGVMRRALRLVEFAFDLHLLVVGHFADCILDSALRLVGCALDVFLVHDRLL